MLNPLRGVRSLTEDVLITVNIIRKMYLLAKEAVNEYPREYKYHIWLAGLEHDMAFNEKNKEANGGKSSSEMIERSIRRYNIVIDECKDSALCMQAIWNSMICYMDLEQYEEALKYAEMLPSETLYTRDKALATCIEGMIIRSWRSGGPPTRDDSRGTEETVLVVY